MNSYAVEKIKFSSYLKLFTLGGLGFGIFMGILSFISVFFDGDVIVTIMGNTLVGLRAGVVSLIMCPFLSVILYVILGLFSFVPFYIILRIKGKLELILRIRGE